MTVGELKNLIKNVKDDVKVFVESDHGQCPESAGGVLYCFNDKPEVDKSYYGEDLQFQDVDRDRSHSTGILIR